MTKKITTTAQENFWAGEFGDDYISRNNSHSLLQSNIDFFKKSLRKSGPLEQVLELGCNIGMNLKALNAIMPKTQLTGVDVLVDYYVKADGGSYSGTPSATQRVTIVNSGTPSSTQMRVGGFDRGSGYSGSLTRYFAVLQDFGGALEIIPNSGGGATSYVVTTAALGASLFPTAQTYKVKIVVRVVEDGTTTVISGSTTPPSSTPRSRTSTSTSRSSSPR